jgi:hypothetical protein
MGRSSTKRGGKWSPAKRSALFVGVVLGVGAVLVPVGATGLTQAAPPPNMPFYGRINPQTVTVRCAPNATTGVTTGPVNVSVHLGSGIGRLGKASGTTMVTIKVPGLGSVVVQGHIGVGKVWSATIPAGHAAPCKWPGSQKAIYTPNPAPLRTHQADRRYKYVKCASGASGC